MRTIEVSTAVFAAIWQRRLPGEETEDAVLTRILTENTQDHAEQGREDDMQGKIRWVDDVCTALRHLGGAADLPEIYRVTQRIRSAAGRTQPASIEATIRRTLEDHSSDSANYRGKDLFKLVSRGRWALR